MADNPYMGMSSYQLRHEWNRMHNSMREGEMRLQSKRNSIGEKLTEGQIAAVERSVAKERAKLAQIEEAQAAAENEGKSAEETKDSRSVITNAIIERLRRAGLNDYEVTPGMRLYADHPVNDVYAALRDMVEYLNIHADRSGRTFIGIIKPLEMGAGIPGVNKSAKAAISQEMVDICEALKRRGYDVEILTTDDIKIMSNEPILTLAQVQQIVGRNGTVKPAHTPGGREGFLIKMDDGYRSAGKASAADPTFRGKNRDHYWAQSKEERNRFLDGLSNTERTDFINWLMKYEPHQTPNFVHRADDYKADSQMKSATLGEVYDALKGHLLDVSWLEVDTLEVKADGRPLKQAEVLAALPMANNISVKKVKTAFQVTVKGDVPNSAIIGRMRSALSNQGYQVNVTGTDEVVVSRPGDDLHPSDVIEDLAFTTWYHGDNKISYQSIGGGKIRITIKSSDAGGMLKAAEKAVSVDQVLQMLKADGLTAELRPLGGDQNRIFVNHYDKRGAQVYPEHVAEALAGIPHHIQTIRAGDGYYIYIDHEMKAMGVNPDSSGGAIVPDEETNKSKGVSPKNTKSKASDIGGSKPVKITYRDAAAREQRRQEMPTLELLEKIMGAMRTVFQAQGWKVAKATIEALEISAPGDADLENKVNQIARSKGLIEGQHYTITDQKVTSPDGDKVVFIIMRERDLKAIAQNLGISTKSSKTGKAPTDVQFNEFWAVDGIQQRLRQRGIPSRPNGIASVWVDKKRKQGRTNVEITPQELEQALNGSAIGYKIEPSPHNDGYFINLDVPEKPFPQRKSGKGSTFPFVSNSRLSGSTYEQAEKESLIHGAAIRLKQAGYTIHTKRKWDSIEISDGDNKPIDVAEVQRIAGNEFDVTPWGNGTSIHSVVLRNARKSNEAKALPLGEDIETRLARAGLRMVPGPYDIKIGTRAQPGTIAEVEAALGELADRVKLEQQDHQVRLTLRPGESWKSDDEDAEKASYNVVTPQQVQQKLDSLRYRYRVQYGNQFVIEESTNLAELRKILGDPYNIGVQHQGGQTILTVQHRAAAASTDAKSSKPHLDYLEAVYLMVEDGEPYAAILARAKQPTAGVSPNLVNQVVSAVNRGKQGDSVDPEAVLPKLSELMYSGQKTTGSKARVIGNNPLWGSYAPRSEAEMILSDMKLVVRDMAKYDAPASSIRAEINSPEWKVPDNIRKGLLDALEASMKGEEIDYPTFNRLMAQVR